MATIDSPPLMEYQYKAKDDRELLRFRGKWRENCEVKQAG